MKLSDLAKKLGLTGDKANESGIVAAIDALVTKANEAAKILPILAKWKGKSITVADMTELANAAVDNPRIDLSAPASCAPEQQLIKTLQDQITASGMAMAKANEKVTAAEQRAVKAETDLSLANSKIVLAETKATSAETTLANVRESLASHVVTKLLKDGKITFAEKDAKKKTILDSADMANEVATLLSSDPKLPTQSRLNNAGGRTTHSRAAAGSNPNTERFQALVNEEFNRISKDNDAPANAYDVAWANVKRANPQVFESMAAETAPPVK